MSSCRHHFAYCVIENKGNGTEFQQWEAIAACVGCPGHCPFESVVLFLLYNGIYLKNQAMCGHGLKKYGLPLLVHLK